MRQFPPFEQAPGDGIRLDADGERFYAFATDEITNAANIRLALRYAKRQGAQLRITPSRGHGPLEIDEHGDVALRRGTY